MQGQIKGLMTRRGPKWRAVDGFGLAERSVARSETPPHTPTEVAAEPPENLVEEMIEDEGNMGISTGTYVLSVVGHSKNRTLHQVGACYRVPGVHFLVVGDIRPTLEQGEKLCASCFGRQQKKVFSEATASEPESDLASSVSSSTDLDSSDSDDN